MKHFIIIFACLFSLIFPWIARGSDFQQQQSTLYPYPSSVFIQDDFLTGGTSTGTIGALGWISAGTVAFQTAETNRPGIIRFDTSAIIATQARLSFGASPAFSPIANHSLLWIIRLNTNDANTTIRIGAGAGVSANPPTDGIFFEKLDADTNWFCVTRAAGVQTRTDSGVAVNTSFNVFSYTRNSSGVQYSINKTSICGTHTTNIPTAGISMWSWIINSVAASKSFDVDYGQFIMTGIVR